MMRRTRLLLSIGYKALIWMLFEVHHSFSFSGGRPHGSSIFCGVSGSGEVSDGRLFSGDKGELEILGLARQAPPHGGGI